MDYTRKEAAAYLNMSEPLLEKILYQTRALKPSYYVERAPMFTQESLDALLAERDHSGLCNASEVARMLGLSRQAISQRIRDGKLVPDMVENRGPNIRARRWFRVERFT